LRGKKKKRWKYQKKRRRANRSIHPLELQKKIKKKKPQHPGTKEIGSQRKNIDHPGGGGEGKVRPESVSKRKEGAISTRIGGAGATRQKKKKENPNQGKIGKGEMSKFTQRETPTKTVFVGCRIVKNQRGRYRGKRRPLIEEIKRAGQIKKVRGTGFQWGSHIEEKKKKRKQG